MSTTHAAREFATSQHTLTCSEVWASNRNVAHAVDLPGLHAWVYAAPLELGHDGGDLHYLSACDEGVLSRVVLADVSGHGQTVAPVAEQLLRLVRRHMNRLEPPALLTELSAALQALATRRSAPYATALAIGFDSSSGTLVFTNAGQPPPLWYIAAERRWTILQRPDAAGHRSVGLPLGLGLGGEYQDTIVRFGADDLLVCYTDGLSEASDPSGLELGAAGLLQLAHDLPIGSPMAAGATLLGLVDAYRRGAPASDDETLIVLQPAR